MNQGSFLIHLGNAIKIVSSCNLLKDKIEKTGRDRFAIKRTISSLEDYNNYIHEVYEMVDYDILLSDESFFQFDQKIEDSKISYRYVYMQNSVRRLTFEEFCEKHGFSQNEEDIDEIEVYFEEQAGDDAFVPNVFPLYLRYDVSDIGYKANVHSYAHLHIGTSGSVRLPVGTILTPDAFVSLCLKLAYPDVWCRNIVENPHMSELYNFKKKCEDIPTNYWVEDEKRDIFLI